MQAPDGSSPPKIPYHESRNAELDGNKFLPPCPSAAAFDHNETDILLEDDSRKLHLSSILTDDQPAVISEPVSAKAFPIRHEKKCAECRRQHQHCDVSLQEKLLSASGQSGTVRCSRCVQRNINCIQATSHSTDFVLVPRAPVGVLSWVGNCTALPCMLTMLIISLKRSSKSIDNALNCHGPGYT